MKYCDVIVDISHEKLDKIFQYGIPSNLENDIFPGVQVVIPFGKGNRKITGYVIEISEEAKFDPAKTKDIISVKRNSLPIESQLIELAAWMKLNFGGTTNQALQTVIPIKTKENIKESRTIVLNIPVEKARVELNQICARPRHAVAKERLLRELIKEGSIPWEVVTQKLEVPSNHIRDFESKSIVRIDRSRQYRNPINVKESRYGDVVLNSYQKAAVESFCKGKEKDVFLLYGVTGSGKTEVYIEMLQSVIDQGKQAIVLIPEIALTYQTVMRFYNRFGDQVSILNSRMTKAERFDQFERAKSGDIKIMVGPRSALFTPFKDLGLIIIDEEHETTYKSDVVPKYHAVPTAIKRAEITGAKVVLGSATPSLDSFMKAKSGTYTMLTLPTRAATDKMASCQIVDMRQELKEGNKSIFSRRLAELIVDRLNKGQQIMLFLNRRGKLNSISCRSCGTAIKCPHCDVAMNLHNDGKLHCHYCGHIEDMPKACPKCSSKLIGGFKVGTQKIEEIINKEFPGARVLRMDADTTAGKNGHEEILSAFSNREADILVGTQMIVKGHDFSNVTLVGVLAADLSLNVPNYLSSERTFQLLTQAVGRAGRGQEEGVAVIQTYQPEHFAVMTSAAQDYEDFYNHEILYRQLLSYPPVSHMLLISVHSQNESMADGRVKEIAELINKDFTDINVLGPADANIKKIADEYRKIITIKCDDYTKLTQIKDMLDKYLLEDSKYSKAYVFFDFDPISGF